MTALRCTAKLLKAMKATPVANPAPATSRLGDWHANLIRVSRTQLVIAVNDATRFGIVVDAAPDGLLRARHVAQVEMRRESAHYRVSCGSNPLRRDSR